MRKSILLILLLLISNYALADDKIKSFSGVLGKGISKQEIANQIIVKTTNPFILRIKSNLSAKGKSLSRKNQEKEVAKFFNAKKAKRLSENIFSIKYKSSINGSQLAKLKSFGFINKIENDYKMAAFLAPNDAIYNFGLLWGENNSNNIDIDAPQAWDLNKGEQVVVAVIDSGLALSHVDLKGNAWINPNEIAGNKVDDDNNGYVDDVNGWDFANNDSSPNDDFYHGSHVSGTIAATGNNSKGVIGVAWNSKIMALKALNKNGSGSTSDSIAALDYVIQAKKKGINVKVVNASFGGGGYSDLFFDKLKELNSLGVVFVAAAGNETNNNDTNPTYPASYDVDNVISVAALDQNGNLASFSNYGSNSVDIAAPGVDIVSTVPKKLYGILSGTSMAAPHVSGILALIASAYPNLNAKDLKAQLTRSAKILSNLNGKMIAPGIPSALNALNNQAGAKIK